jgi:hypothetical protein
MPCAEPERRTYTAVLALPESSEGEYGDTAVVEVDAARHPEEAVALGGAAAFVRIEPDPPEEGGPEAWDPLDLIVVRVHPRTPRWQRSGGAARTIMERASVFLNCGGARTGYPGHSVASDLSTAHKPPQ